MPLPLQLLPPLLMLPQLPPLPMLLPLPSPPPPLSTMLDTRLTIMSSTFPRSLSRGTPPPTPPAMSSTMPQLLVLPSHTTLLSLLPLLPELLELPELSLSKNTQKKMQDSIRTTKFHLKSDKNDKMTNEFENVRFPFP